jgi:hypothetical protein
LLSYIQLSLPGPDVRPDCRFPNIACWHLDLHAAPDLMRRMSLIERCLKVFFQNSVDERNGQCHFRPFSWSHFPPRRHSVLQCSPNGPTMHFVFLGDTPDASKPVFVFSSKTFVELHSAPQSSESDSVAVLTHRRWSACFGCGNIQAKLAPRGHRRQ